MWGVTFLLRTTSISKYYENMFEKIKSYINRQKSKGITWQDGIRPGSCPADFPFLCGKDDNTYDNSFSDIARIAEAFAEVAPFAVDKDGRRLVKQPAIMHALYYPNEEMSGSDFIETLITMLLVHPLVHILVWHYENGVARPGGPISEDNIAGLTFLENAAMSVINGETKFYTTGATYTKQDVITLSLNVNPYQISSGYSPSQAVKRWTTVDDYIADYQAAQFANGGVPSGIISIVARTVAEYDEAVDRIRAAHTGPNNANKVIYTHVPTSAIDGKPQEAGVKWTPFAQSNKDMTLDSLFNQANKKIDMNFGVPEEVKGYLQNSNYASAEVADYVFSRRVIYPKLVKVYSKLTHEFNRIIPGGIDFSIGFDYELPVLTDTRKVQADTLIEMLNAGFSVESAVDALRLPRSFLKLDKTIKEDDQNLQIGDDKKDKPSQAATSKSMHHCDHCNKALDPTVVEEFTDPTLKSLMIAYLTYIFKMAQSRMTGDSVESALSAVNEATERVGTDNQANTIRELVVADLYYLLSQNETAKSGEFAERLNLDAPVITLSADERESLNTSLQNAASQLATNADSPIDIDAIIKETVSKIDLEIDKYGLAAVMSVDPDVKTYHEQLIWLLNSFAVQSLDQLADALLEISDHEQIPATIATLLQNSNYRVVRWATSEQHRAEELGTLLSAEETGDFADLEPVKTWHAHDDGSTCAHCAALNGTSVRADKVFANGDMVPHDHPHCRCWMTIDFRAKQKSVKVFCPHCKRYMFESTGGEVKNVICANSKCKKRFDFDIDGIKIKWVERKEK